MPEENSDCSQDNRCDQHNVISPSVISRIQTVRHRHTQSSHDIALNVIICKRQFNQFSVLFSFELLCSATFSTQRHVLAWLA